MAESDASPPPTGAVSTEEAERLSERFRPSWRTTPRPCRGTSPFRSLPALAPTPAAREAQPTLSGIAPNAARAPHGHGDDLDWELPTNPVPDTSPPSPGPRPAAGTTAEADLAVQIDVVEPPPASKPSGIGEKYIPKDEGAPPVVLNEEVLVAEVGAQAALEAQHRARRAPTIASLKVVELPLPVAEEPPCVPPRRGGSRALAAAGLLVVLLGGAVAVYVARGKRPADEATRVTEPVVTAAPETAAPPPPPPPSATIEEPVVAPEGPAPAVSASETIEHKGAPKAAPAKPTPPAKPVAASKPAVATKPAAKPVAAGPKPATRPAPVQSKPTGGKGVIVRDSPF